MLSRSLLWTRGYSKPIPHSGGMTLSVTLRSLYALVSHLWLTGLPEVAMPYSDIWQDCRITFPHTRPCYAKSSYRSVDPQTVHGDVHQIDHVPNGPTNSTAITTMFPLRLCGGKLLVVVTQERRCGTSRLRVNDDDSPHWQRFSTFPNAVRTWVHDRLFPRVLLSLWLLVLCSNQIYLRQISRMKQRTERICRQDAKAVWNCTSTCRKNKNNTTT